MPSAGQHDQRGDGDGATEVFGDLQRSADVVVARDEQRRSVDTGQRVAQVLTKARAIARNPTGWKARMLAANRSTVSGIGTVQNIVGNNVSKKSVGVNSDRVSAWTRRCSTR